MQYTADTLINPTAKAVLADETAVAFRLWEPNCIGWEQEKAKSCKD